MSIVLFTFIVGLTWLLGLQICVLLKRESLSEVWGLSWFFGMGWGTFVWFLVYDWGRVPFSYHSLMLTLLVLNILGWFGLFLWRPAARLSAPARACGSCWSWPRSRR